MDISSIRKDYKLKQLDKKDVHPNPLVQFNTWFTEAVEAKVNEPNAMNLATVKSSGKPSSRIVLLKGIEEQGFVFYTNYESHKGKELQVHPFGSLCFFWPELERQVRIEGHIKKVEATRSDDYFQSRPYESQLGAWVSPQSQVIDTREFLEQKINSVKKQYPQVVPRPPHWGGFILVPESIEFWQGRESRLHDRMLYELTAGSWQLSRLAP
jgi:pyridoxamine 5'-phosphate oxidase